MKTQIALSMLTALSASMCCIVPLLAIIGGTGSLATSFYWIEPFRPYFISASVLILGFAWFRVFNVKKEDDCCTALSRRSFFRSKAFLSTITIFSLLLITFPTYSKFLFNDGPAMLTEDQDKNKKIVIPVSGMTCTSCEIHIESEVKKLPGVSYVKVSYEKGQATVEFDEQKIKSEMIIATINATGYKVEELSPRSILGDQTGNCCANGTCKDHQSLLPTEENRNLKIVSGVEEIKNAFNQRDGKTKFVAILSSTCGWCLAGANSVQKAVIEKMKDKNISVIIVWTNMLKADDQRSAFKAASLFKDPNVTQFFDPENKLGDLVAQRLNPKGTKAWDIYMFFDQEAEWGKTLARPFEYAHQLSSSVHPWVDGSKYFCGANLTKKLTEITETL